MKAILLKKTIIGVCLWGACFAAAYAQQGLDSQGRDKPVSEGRNRARIHTELGSVYYQNGNMAVALDELRIALEADSSYFPALSVRGLVHAQLREYAQADADFQRALSLAPNDPQVNNNYGWYLCDTGKERQSIAYFLNAVKNPLYETPDRAYGNAGACALKAGDLVGAETYLQKALMLSRDGAAPSRVQLASLYYQRGLIEESRRYLGEALKMMEPPSAEALWLGIRIERKLGNRVVEGGYVSQLRSRYPGSKEYQDFLVGKFND